MAVNPNEAPEGMEVVMSDASQKWRCGSCSEVADALESIDGRLAALEAAEKDRAQRKDWAVGAKVPA